MLIGGELGHSWLVDRRIMDVSVYGAFRRQPVAELRSASDPDTTGVNLPQFVAGVRESNLGADAGAALSAKVTDAMRLYIVYDGRFRSNLTSHSGTVGAEFRWWLKPAAAPSDARRRGLIQTLLSWKAAPP